MHVPHTFHVQWHIYFCEFENPFLVGFDHFGAPSNGPSFTRSVLLHYILSEFLFV